jgi:hypothetical protein
MLAALLVGMLGAVLAVAAWVIGWILLVRGEGGGWIRSASRSINC